MNRKLGRSRWSEMAVILQIGAPARVVRSRNFRIALVASLMAMLLCAQASAFTVTSSADSGAGTFRQAILDANTSSGADTIYFDAAVTSIALSSALPTVTDTLIIDGTVNHPGSYVELNGNGITGSGLTFSANSCELYGMYIHGFSIDGVDVTGTSGTVGGANKGNVISGNLVDGVYVSGSGVVINGNYIGTDVTGLIDNGNGGNGLELAGAGATVRGNVISGNGADGINCTGTGLAAYGNTIGLGSDGATLIRNDSNGIELSSAATNAIIGTAAVADRNIVSGNGSSNSFYGIKIAGATATITGNYVGTDSTGLVDKGNKGHGLSLTGAGATVRGNVISGNGNDGINATGAGLGVYGNIIGLGSDGSTFIKNDHDSINLTASASGAVIGTSAIADRNVLATATASGGTVEVRLFSSGTVVKGNYIGTNATGSSVVGTADDGVWMFGSNNIIGGTGAGEGNLIMGGSNAGVYVYAGGSDTISGNNISNSSGYGGVLINAGNNTVTSNTIHDNSKHGVVIIDGSNTGNRIQQNSIYDNPGIAIGLGWFGPLSNDVLDVDTGANNRQNYPSVGPVRPGDTVLTGTLSSAASTTYRLDFYRNPGCSSFGYGEAREWLGNTNVTTDASGSTTFTFTLASSAVLGEAYTATATDPGNNTSCISQCSVVDTDPNPNVTAITRAAGSDNPTSGPSVVFHATFDQPVKGLDTANFGVTQDGTLSGSVVTAVTVPTTNVLTLARTNTYSRPTGNVDLSNRSFTIEFWANRDAIGSPYPNDYPIGYRASDTTNNHLYLGWESGFNFRFSFYNNNLDTITEWGIIKEWDHWACTYDNSTGARKIYRNGVELAADISASPILTSGKLLIGDQFKGGYAGKLDEVRVWGVARTQAQIAANMYTPATGAESNLLALYRCDSISDLGVNADGADDLADSAGAGLYPLDRTSGTGSPIVASTIYATSADINVSVGTGDGHLGLSIPGKDAITNKNTFSLNTPAITGETFTISHPTPVQLSGFQIE